MQITATTNRRSMFSASIATRNFSLLMLALLGVSLSATAHAAEADGVVYDHAAPIDYTQPSYANEADRQSLELRQTAPGSKWDVALGAGAMVRPTYEGSDKYTVSPVPFVNATYDDMLSLGPNGLDAYWHHDHFRVGAGLSYNGGRKDSEDNSIFSTGDDRLRGLGNIDGALGVKAFGAYDFGVVNVGLSATKFTGNQNDGVIAEAEVSRMVAINRKLMLRPYAGLTWADQNYMQTFFGVTPAQAANSSFSPYDAGAGIKNFSAGVDGRYSFDEHWFASARADIKRFTGDAADSPITMSSTNATVLTMIGYHF